ncbi:MAG: hypothetical protein V4487_03565 [Chlamydiota bacterium]
MGSKAEFRSSDATASKEDSTAPETTGATIAAVPKSADVQVRPFKIDGTIAPTL